MPEEGSAERDENVKNYEIYLILTDVLLLQSPVDYGVSGELS